MTFGSVVCDAPLLIARIQRFRGQHSHRTGHVRQECAAVRGSERGSRSLPRLQPARARRDPRRPGPRQGRRRTHRYAGARPAICRRAHRAAARCPWWVRLAEQRAHGAVCAQRAPGVGELFGVHRAGDDADPIDAQHRHDGAQCSTDVQSTNHATPPREVSRLSLSTDRSMAAMCSLAMSTAGVAGSARCRARR